MKIRVPGDTPHERLLNLTRRLVAVPKVEIDTAIKREQQRKQRRRRREK